MPSIRDEAYALCKSVLASPSIANLRSAYLNIHSTWFEYHTRQFNAQFLAYLLVDEHLDLVNQRDPEPVPHLLPHERDLLFSAHQQVVDLDRLCLAPIQAGLPQIAIPMFMAALDPYNRFSISPLPTTRTPTLLTPEAMERMARSFHSHPAIGIALDNLGAYAGTILDTVRDATAFNTQPEPNLVVHVLDWTRLLTSKGATDVGSELTRLTLYEPTDSPNRPPARFISALASLRTSLAALNQLVYQATFTDKLPILDEDNVIDLKTTPSLVSTLADVVFQRSEKLALVTTGQLVRLKLPDQVDMLAQVEPWSMEFADDTIQTVLREVDENLNLFGPLLRNI
jgi:hypothetical protein